jgi:hypothetical protein
MDMNQFSEDVLAAQRDLVSSLKTQFSLAKTEAENLSAKLQELQMAAGRIAIEERVQSGILQKMEDINGHKSD